MRLDLGSDASDYRPHYGQRAGGMCSLLSSKWLRSEAPEGTGTIPWQQAGNFVIGFSLKACLLVARLNDSCKALCQVFSGFVCGYFGALFP